MSSTAFEIRGRLVRRRPIQGVSELEGCDAFILPHGDHTEPLRVRLVGLEVVRKASILEGARVTVTGTLRAAGVLRGHRVVEVVLAHGHDLVVDAVSPNMFDTQEFIAYLTDREVEPSQLDAGALTELLIAFIAEHPPEVFSGLGRERIEHGLRVTLSQDPTFAQEIEEMLEYLRLEEHVEVSV